MMGTRIGWGIGALLALVAAGILGAVVFAGAIEDNAQSQEEAVQTETPTPLPSPTPTPVPTPVPVPPAEPTVVYIPVQPKPTPAPVTPAPTPTPKPVLMAAEEIECSSGEFDGWDDAFDLWAYGFTPSSSFILRTTDPATCEAIWLLAYDDGYLRGWRDRCSIVYDYIEVSTPEELEFCEVY